MIHQVFILTSRMRALFQFLIKPQFIIFLLIASYVSAYGNHKRCVLDSVLALRIGDTIPEYLWHLPLQVVNHPTGKDTVTLDDYKDKLIVLDFWATWCKPCLKSLDKLDTIRNSLHPDLVFFPVAYENESAVAKVLTSRKWQMPIIVGEHGLDTFFPHRVVPHFVWIYGSKVRAYTDPNAFTHENIEAILQDSTFKLTEKTDREPDYFKPIIDYTQQQEKIDAFVQSAITGYLPGIGGMGIRTRDSLTVQYLLNCTLSEMYRIALGVSFENFILEGDTPLVNDNDTRNMSKYDYLYCYQIIVPSEMPAAKKYQKMVSDLNAYFGLTTAVEERDAECYIIKPIDGQIVDNINAHTQEETGKTFTLTQFVKSLNHAGKLVEYMPLFVNAGDVDIRIPRVPHPSELKYDIPRLRQILSNYGLTIEKSIRPLTFLVIRKTSEPPVHLN